MFLRIRRVFLVGTGFALAGIGVLAAPAMVVAGVFIGPLASSLVGLGFMDRRPAGHGERPDERERRHPQGFTRWLATGARADDDPRPYLSTDRRAGPEPAAYRSGWRRVMWCGLRGRTGTRRGRGQRPPERRTG